MEILYIRSGVPLIRFLCLPCMSRDNLNTFLAFSRGPLQSRQVYNKMMDHGWARTSAIITLPYSATLHPVYEQAESGGTQKSFELGGPAQSRIVCNKMMDHGWARIFKLVIDQ